MNNKGDAFAAATAMGKFMAAAADTGKAVAEGVATLAERKRRGFGIDSELKRFLVPLSDDQLLGLERELVAAGGPSRPLVVWDEGDVLVDGHNRLSVCEKHGLPWSVERISFPDIEAVKSWMRRNQLGQRNLTPEAISYLRGQEYLARKLDRADASSIRNSCGYSSADAIAAEFGASSRTIENDARFAAAMDRVANVLGDDVRDKVLCRDAKVSRKDVTKLAEFDDDKITEFGRQLLDGSAKRLSDAIRASEQATLVESDAPAFGTGYRVILGDMNEVMSSIEPGSIDVIITDPPYPQKYLHVYEDLARHAAKVLRPGGSCVAMCGQSYLGDIFRMMSEHLVYNWTLAYLTPGGQAVQMWQRKVNTFWKPLLWFVNGKYDGPWVGDVSKSNTNDNDKSLHHWGQSESGMFDIVNRVSRRGDLVLDPFSGAATTGIACMRSGRRYLGVEIDEDKYSLSLSRLEAEARHSCVRAESTGQSALFGGQE